MSERPPTTARDALLNAGTCLLYLGVLVLYCAGILAWLVAPAWLLGRVWPRWIAFPVGVGLSLASGWWFAARVVLKGGLGGSNPLRRPPGRRGKAPPGKSGAPPTRSMRGPLASRHLDDPD